MEQFLSFTFSILLLLDFLANVEIIFCWNIWERMTWNSFIRNKFTLKIESTLKQSHFLITFIALKMKNHHRFKIALFCGLYPEGKKFFWSKEQWQMIAFSFCEWPLHHQNQRGKVHQRSRSQHLGEHPSLIPKVVLTDLKIPNSFVE